MHENGETEDVKKQKIPPEMSIEWKDVEIEIKVLLKKEFEDESKFVSLFPTLDPELMSLQEVEEIKKIEKLKRRLDRHQAKENQRFNKRLKE